MILNKESIITLIDKAFDGVAYPQCITIHVAAAHDDYKYDHDEQYRALDYHGDRKDIPQSDLLYSHVIFSYFEADSTRYYLPAYMNLALQHRDHGDIVYQNDNDVLEHFGFKLGYRRDIYCAKYKLFDDLSLLQTYSGGLHASSREFYTKKFSLLSNEQHNAIFHCFVYLQYRDKVQESRWLFNQLVHKWKHEVSYQEDYYELYQFILADLESSNNLTIHDQLYPMTELYFRAASEIGFHDICDAIDLHIDNIGDGDFINYLIIAKDNYFSEDRNIKIIDGWIDMIISKRRNRFIMILREIFPTLLVEDFDRLFEENSIYYIPQRIIDFFESITHKIVHNRSSYFHNRAIISADIFNFLAELEYVNNSFIKREDVGETITIYFEHFGMKGVISIEGNMRWTELIS